MEMRNVSTEKNIEADSGVACGWGTLQGYRRDCCQWEESFVRLLESIRPIGGAWPSSRTYEVVNLCKDHYEGQLERANLVGHLLD
jgi:hypothetical protein